MLLGRQIETSIELHTFAPAICKFTPAVAWLEQNFERLPIDEPENLLL